MIYKKQYFVYLTTNKINNKKYVGKHYGFINDGYLGSGILFKEAVQKYGKNNFTRQILEFCLDSKDLNEAEKRWIKFFHAVENENFYNIELGGQGGQNYQTLKQWYLDNPEKGKEIYLNNAIRVNKWKQKHPEIIKKATDAMQAGYQKWRQKHPEQYKEKIQKTIETQGICVKCVETGEIFHSISEAARAYNLSASQISRVINGQRKHAGKTRDGTKLSWKKINKTS